MEPYKDDKDLAAELRALRPEPRQEFSAELDERAAAGFPRRSSRAGSPLAGLLSRLRAVPPRRLALSAGATALAAVAAATVVVAVSEPGNDSASLARLSTHQGSADIPAAIAHGKVTRTSDNPSLPSGAGSSSNSAGIQYETEAPATAAPERGMSDSGSSAASESASAASGPAITGSSSSPEASRPAPAGPGPFASNADRRNVERSAEMVLGAEPADVAGDAAEVFDAVHAADGIVLSSSVTGGAAGDAGARFDLLIPAAKLSDALADFSAIGTVVSRHEATDDITAPTVRTGEHLRDSRARIDGLLVQLAGADSDEERTEVEAELQAERRQAAALRSQAAELGRRANLSRVSLRIETGAGATAPDEGGAWGVDDALDDAGHILAIAAGVAIVGLAILGPIALIALLAWLANCTRLRRARERALA
jgi:hypothetical protein